MIEIIEIIKVEKSPDLECKYFIKFHIIYTKILKY